MQEVKFSELNGKVLSHIDGLYIGSKHVTFYCSNDIKYHIYCDKKSESAEIKYIAGNVSYIKNRNISTAIQSSEMEGDYDSDDDDFEFSTFCVLETECETLIFGWKINSLTNYFRGISCFKEEELNNCSSGNENNYGTNMVMVETTAYVPKDTTILDKLSEKISDLLK